MLKLVVNIFYTQKANNCEIKSGTIRSFPANGMPTVIFTAELCSSSSLLLVFYVRMNESYLCFVYLLPFASTTEIYPDALHLT